MNKLNESKLFDIHKYLNDKNAIVLNCRDPTKYMQVYEDVLNKAFNKNQDG